MATSATAFTVVPSLQTHLRSASLLSAVTRPDTSSAIEQAMKVSQKYGASSREAAVAWDAVEEMDSSDNRYVITVFMYNENILWILDSIPFFYTYIILYSARTSLSLPNPFFSNAFLPSLDSECLVEEDISKACLEYGSKLDELSALLAETAPKVKNLKSVANELSNIKLKVASSQPGTDSPQLRQALAIAKQITAVKGVTSPEAKLAWEDVEEIASAGSENSMGVRLDQECLVESAMEACQALEELNRVLNLQQSKIHGTGGP